MISANFLFIVIASTCLIVSNEFLKRKFILPVYLTRKLAHFGGSFIAFLSPYFITQQEIILISLIFVVTLFFTRQTTLFSSIHAVKRDTLGEVFLPAGVAASALFFLPDHALAFQFGILIMGISDGLAGLIGEGLGKHKIKILGGGKTVEGSCVFFLTSLTLTTLFASGLGHKALLAAFILTAVEFFLEYGLDNLALPVLAGYLLIILT